MNNKELRAKAEYLLQNATEKFNQNEINTLREALHELNVSQVELTIQNEELQNANA